MNLEEFYKKYEGINAHQKIEIACDKCGKIVKYWKTRAQQKISKYGIFLDKSCAMKHRFELGLSLDVKEKLRKGRLGKKHSEETRKLMSNSANKKWQTDWGKQQKKRLSKSATAQNASKNLDKSKRKILYISVKNNDIRVCNSSYEYIFCEDFLEKDETIKKYETQISYDVDGRNRSLDVLIEYMDGRFKVIEIKPKKRLNEEFHIQQMSDSKANADKNGWEFEIWTEKELNIKRSKEATARADAYRKEHYLIDYAAYRQQKDRDKANKHYHKHNEKILVGCNFCNTYHVRRKKQIQSNIDKNGRYICEKENGHIVGKMPKKKKVNPYEESGMKQCKGKCARILPFDCFSKCKATCKECRSEIYKAKYHNKKKDDHA